MLIAIRTVGDIQPKTIYRCSSLGLPVLDKLQGGPGRMGLSQSINMTFHAPAPLYVKIFFV
jgi:hypothetical protein